jgi:hypothetical protein
MNCSTIAVRLIYVLCLFINVFLFIFYFFLSCFRRIAASREFIVSSGERLKENGKKNLPSRELFKFDRESNCEHVVELSH